MIIGTDLTVKNGTIVYFRCYFCGINDTIDESKLLKTLNDPDKLNCEQKRVLTCDSCGYKLLEYAHDPVKFLDYIHEKIKRNTKKIKEK